MNRIAINGFGRIGRSFLRSILDDPSTNQHLSIVAINVGPCEPGAMDHSVKYDSLMGTYAGDVEYANNTLHVGGHEITIIKEPHPNKAPWKELSIDWVVEASGCFTDADSARGHLEAGAKKVAITAPAKGEDVTIVPGVNSEAYNKQQHSIVSLGSCTTNCFASVVKVLNDAFGIEQGIMNTVHAYTNNQVLLDVEHPDPRRSRAAALNIIPAKTGAATTIFKVFPELEGKLIATAVRVPVPKVSLLDFTFMASKELSVDAINTAFKQAVAGPLASIVGYTDEPLVSCDYNNSTYSAVIDGPLTQVLGTQGRVSAWYDNEYGYACRVRDFLVSDASL